MEKSGFVIYVGKSTKHYFSSLDQNGIRLDINERPELFNGSYEYILDKNFSKCKMVIKTNIYFCL